jgi:hypothetical protein
VLEIPVFLQEFLAKWPFQAKKPALLQVFLPWNRPNGAAHQPLIKGALLSMSTCPFCPPKADEIRMESEYCLYIASFDEVLQGFGMIVPKAHRETVFDLTSEEASDTHALLLRVKAWTDANLLLRRRSDRCARSSARHSPL